MEGPPNDEGLRERQKGTSPVVDIPDKLDVTLHTAKSAQSIRLPDLDTLHYMRRPTFAGAESHIQKEGMNLL